MENTVIYQGGIGMATKTEDLTPLEKCKECITSKRSFVLQGGAGSGKTETLKELLLYTKNTMADSRVMCITHTNVAVDEIKSRVGNIYTISTIHSFLNSLIKDYKKNMKSVISKLFILEEMSKGESYLPENDYKKQEHDKFKKIYGKYASKLYDLKKETAPKVAGKREYDINPDKFNEELNAKIRCLNEEISKYVEDFDCSKIHYNDTKFNSYLELSYGHDGLLELFDLLFSKYPILRKMIADKYDYVFIDEYQDTNPKIISNFISLSKDYNLTVGLFGDSMQAIYSDGIGDVQPFIDKGELTNIPKPDNFRCSYQVIDFINELRFDGIKQEVAFKQNGSDKYETEKERQGEASVIYSICEKKATTRSTTEDKEQYQKYIDDLIEKVRKEVYDSKVLMLTNKSISQKNEFEDLYKIFDDRYVDVKDRIESYLSKIQVLNVGEICMLYEAKKFNELIAIIRKGGFVIKKSDDKMALKKNIEYLLKTPNLSLWDAVKYAQKQRLIKLSESYNNTINRNNAFLEELKNNTTYQKFKEQYNQGDNTYNKMGKYGLINSEEEFRSYVSLLKKENFIECLFSNKTMFSEIINYMKYLNEETQFVTMHKTKGSSISSVIVVMEEFYWQEYDFSFKNIEQDISKERKRLNSQRLIYVACSRARNSVICTRVIGIDEKDDFLKMFPNATLFKDYTKQA